jgi:hypothetical protein
MPNENPWAYSEARDRIREKKEKETIIIEVKKEEFEKWKEKLRKKKWLDVHGLRQKIETGHSLNSLKSDIRSALSEGMISRDTYESMMDVIWDGEKNNIDTRIDPSLFPLSQNRLAIYLENQKLGDNIWVDIVWFLYWLVVQGSAFLIIIAWKILTDIVLLPRDIYREVKVLSSKV